MNNQHIRQLVVVLAASFRAEIDALQLRAYERALQGMTEDVLVQATDRLVMAAARGEKYYPVPTPPQCLEMCHRVISERRIEAVKLHLEHCDHDSHFEEIDGKLQRCSCFRRAMIAMKEADPRLLAKGY